MTDYDKALRDPSAVYQFPREVLADETLTHEQKREILLRWKQDAQQLEIAEEENMAGEGAPIMLSRVNRCLDLLAQTDLED
jgi:hypothetical protein